MKPLACAPVELLLERQSPQLSHAERLRVEAHLGECERCRQEHGAMLQLIAASEQRVQSAAKASVQQRAIARALGSHSVRPNVRDLATLGAPAPSGSPTLAWRPVAVAAVALMVSVAVAWGVSRSFGPEQSVAVVETANRDHVLLGNLVGESGGLSIGQAIPSDQDLRVDERAVVQLAHAELSVTHAQKLRWSATSRTVTLFNASADISVDPTKGQSFRVATADFVVDVLGTEFSVDQGTVRVRRGRVRISSATAEKTLAILGPGQSWTYQKPEPAVASNDESPTVAKQPSVPKPTIEPQPSGKELLAQARQRLSSGDAAGARRDVNAALGSALSRAEQAEAYMLKAECSLVQGDSKSAVRQYLDVNQRFAGLRAAETALFAAARVQSNTGQHEAAKKLLSTYLQSYPKGQFRKEAQARLRILEGR